MDPEMQQKCEKKLRELKECMPFLLKVLEKLRSNNRNDSARQTQLEKIQKLYNLLNDKSQIFKWDLLVKCENVVKKLQKKMELQEKQTSPSIAEENIVSVKDSENKLNREEINCPESPPPQDNLDDFETIQPVVIPTERRSSPPLPRKRRENHETTRENNNKGHHRKHSHIYNRHSHHNHHTHQRNHSHYYQYNKQNDSSQVELLKKQSFNNISSYNAELSPNAERNDQQAIIESYLSVQRKRDECNRLNVWQRRVQSFKQYDPEEPWSDFSNEQHLVQEEYATTHQCKNINNNSGNTFKVEKQSIFHQSKGNVFDRLGEKISDCDSVNGNKKSFEKFHFKTNNDNQFHSSKTDKEFASPIVADFLKSPPLTASDLTLLLDETNTNSNSSDSRNISKIGMRRQTPSASTSSKNQINANGTENTHLDIVRKKLAMLTKSETSGVTSTSTNEISLAKSLTSKINPQNEIASTKSNNQTISPYSAERVALKYHPHPRHVSTQSNNSSDGLAVISTANVNVLPTLHPNDPRLRKSNQAIQTPIISRNMTQPSAAIPTSIMSPKSNPSMSPGTPSPLYGNISKKPPLTVPIVPITVKKVQTNDPRLQRGRTQPSLQPALNQKRPLLVQCDSSDENWDLDDNVCEVTFPKPRPFPNQPHTHTSERTTPNLPNTQISVVHSEPPRRKSLSWENGFPTSMPPIATQNNFTNSNTSWLGGPPALLSLNLNTTIPTKTHDHDRLNTFQDNVPAGKSNYSVPRTYGAYKEAKARAAAELAARKEAEEAKTQKAIVESEEKIVSRDAELTSTNSNLDTTYRDDNYSNCEFSKTINNFKIPKKTAESIDLEETGKVKSRNLEKGLDVSVSQKSDDKFEKKARELSLDLETTKECKLKILDLKPKPQRSKFKTKHSGYGKSKAGTAELKTKCPNSPSEKSDIITASHSFENMVWHVLDEVTNSDAEADIAETKKTKKTKQTMISPKGELLENQPPRILTRRCTMVDKASTPEVDKEKLFKSSAMLFEDLQERERKKQVEAVKKVHANIRRHVGEICYDKTDDGCTVSTQNIITGKRRTRTTANFNEVQQGIAVFKHLKSNDQKKDTSPAAKNATAAVKERKKTGHKPKIKPDQEKAKASENPILENKKCSRKRRKSVVVRDIKEKIQETKPDTLPNVNSIFDTFIQKILNPITNANELINKLRDILSEQEVETLLSVREAMMKKQKKIEQEEVVSDEKSLSKLVDSDIKNEALKSETDEEKTTKKCAVDFKVQPQSETEATYTRPKAARRNELDRLHEDIRDMFISEGVLTATGKRMCTFVEPTSSKATEFDQNKGSTEIENTRASKSLTPPKTTPASVPVATRVRKTRVLLPTLKVQRTTVRRSLRKTQTKQEEVQDEEVSVPASSRRTSFSSDITEISSKSETTVSTVSTVSTINTITSSCSYTKSDNEPLRCMPVLKAVTPLRLPEEDELDEWLAKQKEPITTAMTVAKIGKLKQKKYKPCPKSKKPPNALLEDDDNDNAEMENSTKEVEIAGEHHHIKTEMLDITVPYEDLIPNLKNNKLVPLNINPKWHWASRYAYKCVICKQKCNFMSAHYKKCHPENYVSRLAPIILEQIKQEHSTLNKPILKLTNKRTSMKVWLLHRCPFCLQFKYTSYTGWLEHFITHTGEYFYECTLCHKAFNKPALIERHMQNKCAKNGGRYLHNDEFNRSFKDNEINAHVCHLCNYIRLGRLGLERHYMEQHNYNVKSINASIGYTISLIKGKDVPSAETLEELEETAAKLSEKFQTDIISLNDDENDTDETNEKQKKLTDAIMFTEKQTTTIDNISNEEATVKIPKKSEQRKKSASKKTVKLDKSNANSSDLMIKNHQKSPKIENKIVTTEIISTQENPVVVIPLKTSVNSEKNSNLKTVLSAPLSSVFISTTDDSNDADGPTILARKLLTVENEADICNKSSPTPRLSGSISMAERLSQRLKEAEANTNTANTANNMSSLQQQQKEIEANTTITPKETQLIEVSRSSEEVNDITQNHSVPENAVQSIEKTQSPKLLSTLDDKSDEGEIDLTLEEDDEEWEDIEIVETGPSTTANSNSILQKISKDSKNSKSKMNSLHRLSRFHANSKSNKKSKNLKPLMTLLSGVNNTNKESNQNKEMGMEVTKITTIATKITTIPTATTSTTTSDSSQPNSTFNPAPLIGFRPMIANLSDLLPDSPCNDPIEIAPELAPSGPLQELNDITSFLGSNLSGIMDIEVEDPSNSICIHNSDNHQTSIHEALNFETSQIVNYDETQTISQSLGPNDDCLTFGRMTIHNIGYKHSIVGKKQIFRFYCLSDRCTFIYSSEAIGLENHFLFEHPQAKWNGYCKTCDRQVKVPASPFDLRFSDEFNHLLEVHIKQPIPAILSSMPANETTSVSNDENNASSSEPPRIKLRRLSGDCLSVSTMQSDSHSSSLIEANCDSNSFSDLMRLNSRKTTTTTPGSEQFTEVILPTNTECVSDDVPLFTNISKDFQITSISSGLEPTELSSIVKSALNVEASINQTNIANGNSCPLQISNVISLGEPSTAAISDIGEDSPLSLPKITNVRSLSGSSETAKIAENWTQQINNERVELAQSSAESMEMSAILANAQLSENSFTKSTNLPLRFDNDSPGPTIVSETLPAGQATSGNFVLTQTVSAQYADETEVGGSAEKPKLGFNISISSAPLTNVTTTTKSEPANQLLKPIWNCMEYSCKYKKQNFLAIIDHVKWHEKKNDTPQREYLRCSLCQQKLNTVDAFTKHLREEHYSSADSPTITILDSSQDDNARCTPPALNVGPVPAPSATIVTLPTCPLTEKIRNILIQNQVEITSKENSIVTEKSLSQNPIDILASKKMDQNLDKESIAFKTRLTETITEMVSRTGICENKIFRCSVKECNVKLNESTYHTHVLNHLSTLGGMHTTFPCPHCKSKFQNILSLKTHIKSHGRHKIFCYLCMETAVNETQLSRHFTEKHCQKERLRTSVLLKCERNGENELVYLVSNSSPLSESDIHEFGKKLIIEWQRKKAATRSHFNPDEMDLLPIQAIFSKEIYCALCLYKTKVRTNMVRHMHQHTKTINSVCGSMNTFGERQKDGDANDSSGNMMFSSMDPINPVPCLISNEKHFDRMTNLASSSLVPQSANNTSVTNTNNPVSSVGCKLRFSYIPQSKRFICGIPGCQYLTISEDIFRSHLNALHSDVSFYQCLFCNEELCKRSLVVERILQHLRFHDRTIYQCEQCEYNHYIRHVVDRHALEKHGTVDRANVLMFVRDEEGAIEGTKKVIIAYGKKSKDINITGVTLDTSHINFGGKGVEKNTGSGATSALKTAQKFPKYICDLCGHKTVTFNQQIAHSNAQHSIKKPYQCRYCLYFTDWSEQNIITHITQQHPGEELKVTRIFGKMNPEQLLKARKELLMQQNEPKLNEPPPKPLWQRDDPKRARQIRGIPMEDEEDSERLRKRLRLSEDYDDEDDGEILGGNTSTNYLGQSVSNLFLNRFEFGCFYCEYKATSIDELKKTHWESIHNHVDSLSSKPFLFRLLIRLKCAECQNFIGCFWELQRHMSEDHAKPTSHAADPRAKKLTCGYCDYDCVNATQILRHYLREDHQPQDIKGLTSVQMAKVMRLESGSPTVFVHCSLCSELFTGRATVVHHAGEKHSNEAEHFSFRELSNTTIYRCPECLYTSTIELETLRHMINHYRRFKHCNFCRQAQTTFNGYMQHCYSDHRTEIRRFSEIYPLHDIRKYLMGMLIIFPNGWIVNKKNLRNTPYGNEERIKTLYAEICKTSQEPPIPRLSLGRLVARKSIEAKQQQQKHQQEQPCNTNSTSAVLDLAENEVDTKKLVSTAQKITKRRSTIAIGNIETSFLTKQNMSNKKHKMSPHIDVNQPVNLPPVLKFGSVATSTETLLTEPFSYYGQKPEKENWANLHTKISIAGVNTPISLDKFKILVRIDVQVVLEKLDIEKYKLQKHCNKQEEEVDSEVNKYKHVKKACPASQKYRFT